MSEGGHVGRTKMQHEIRHLKEQVYTHEIVSKDICARGNNKINIVLARGYGKIQHRISCPSDINLVYLLGKNTIIYI